MPPFTNLAGGGVPQHLRIPRSIWRDGARSPPVAVGTYAFEQSRRDRKRMEMLFAHLKRNLRLDGRWLCTRNRGASCRPSGSWREHVADGTPARLQWCRVCGAARGLMRELVGPGGLEPPTRPL